jgi:hypothetical protein
MTVMNKNGYFADGPCMRIASSLLGINCLVIDRVNEQTWPFRLFVPHPANKVHILSCPDFAACQN